MSQTDRLTGYVGSVGIKNPCACASSAPIVLAGEQVVDGVQTANSRVLVMGQADTTTNGIYVSNSGIWERALDFDGPYNVACGTMILVTGGATNNNVWTVTTASPITIGTSHIAFGVQNPSLALLGLSSGAGLVGFKSGLGGAVARTVLSKERDIVSCVDLGVIGDGATDNGATMQAAIAACAAAGVDLYVPAPAVDYSMATPSVNTAMCSIHGDGKSTSVFKWRGAGGAVVFTFNLTTDPGGITLRDFGIVPSVSGTGATAIKIVPSGAGGNFANSTIERCTLGGGQNLGFSSYGLIIDNSAEDHSAIFTDNIKGCNICNGMQLLKAGDSVTIERNNISCVSSAIGNSSIGVYITGMSGAAQKTIRDNSITAGNGAIYMKDCIQSTIEHNQCEWPGISTGTFVFNHALNNDSWINIVTSSDIRIVRNTIQTGIGNATVDANCPGYGITFDGGGLAAPAGDSVPTVGCVLRDNTINAGNITSGTRYHVAFINKAYGNIVGINSWQTTNNKPSIYLLDPEAYPQIGFPMDLNAAATSPWVNGWSLDSTNGITRMDLLLEENGVAHLYGEAKNAGGSGASVQTIINLPSPVIPSVPASMVTIGKSSAGAYLSSAGCVMYLTLATPSEVMYAIAPTSCHVTLTGLTFPYYISR